MNQGPRRFPQRGKLPNIFDMRLARTLARVEAKASLVLGRAFRYGSSAPNPAESHVIVRLGYTHGWYPGNCGIGPAQHMLLRQK